ncbi:hypothetical protein AKJ48_01935 [candidate division MSBL1 archaeon SCGC-AAA261O19]|uniref:DOD-type homing endonuclease domain-containing protein n=3 Tax=candidate division MSBL1 TaxID=215777 RepID=A0A133V0D3_9EURY|nr:hypothetical protein AKJ42_02265 [candidate division MSBL1 archaeon SCGC-AAA261C02]KXB04624.1 hypothetical protein AKJ48_01935 [candidate division MSBL1 archaeon SCGC-AAA261O19]KXB09211.1 hypothetical protein AKJ46_00735 [candidate division MSBL1 archaeon SCGC-AAA833K04]
MHGGEVEFSFQDRKQNILIPDSVTKEVAYETGVHIGDGWMNIIREGQYRTPHHRVSYTGNLIDELKFHKEILIPLIHRIYNKHAYLMKRPGNVCETAFKSKAIVSFKSKVLRLPKGPKRTLKGIPHAIVDESDKCVRECVRGIADTDFSLAFLRKHRGVHYYPKIRYSSPSKNLVKDIEYWLGDIFDFDVASCYDIHRKDPRIKGILTTHTLELNGRAMLEKWMDEIGFRNEKHLSKFHL